jgi:hypothetical protein
MTCIGSPLSFRTPIVERNGQERIVRPSSEYRMQAAVEKLAVAKGRVFCRVVTLDR